MEEKNWLIAETAKNQMTGPVAHAIEIYLDIYNVIIKGFINLFFTPNKPEYWNQCRVVQQSWPDVA